MKKALSILLSVCLIIGLMPLAVHAETAPADPYSDAYLDEVYSQMSDSCEINALTDNSVTVIRARYLYDFADTPVAIFYEFSPKGYAIYDYEGSVVLEYSKDNNHPFYVDTDTIYYYNGVFEYYIAEENSFVNMATGAIADTERSY